jgi:spermidine synthase
MLFVFALTLFSSATLLFLVQPMVGKLILPLLGGTPAVWNTCMVFFQTILLAGYAYAHATTTWLGTRRQAILHMAVLAVPLLFFPLEVRRDLLPATARNPIPALLLALTVCAGVPFFVVSASAPLLQKWFSSTAHPAARDPYFLYAASNLGSMLALLSYPTLVEPMLGLKDQCWIWGIGYGMLVVLTAVCATLLWVTPGTAAPTPSARREPSQPSAPNPPSRKGGKGGGRRARGRARVPITAPAPASASAAPPSLTGASRSWARRLRWLVLAAVPSSLMLGSTTYITTDLAPVPFLWVLPLALYLLSFILVFARPAAVLHRIVVWTMPPAVAVVVLLMFLPFPPGLAVNIAAHLLVLFLAAMVCHGELARDRPDPSGLTEYYLWMSMGGVSGGLFNAILAPLAFDSLIEYPLALVLACLLLPPGHAVQDTARRQRRDWVVAGSLGMAGLVLGLLGLLDSSLSWSIPLGKLGLVTPALLALTLGAVLAVGQGSNRTATRMDLVLPCALGVLTVGLLLGLRASRFEPALQTVAQSEHINVAQLRMLLTYGTPLVIACMFLRRPLCLGLCLGAVLLVQDLDSLFAQRLLYRGRSFFAALRIGTAPASSGPEPLEVRWLAHGKTVHGQQFLEEHLHDIPLSYFHRTSPIGQVLTACNTDPKVPIGVIGLGAGTLAAYARPGQRLTLFEIDPLIGRLSDGPGAFFTFLSDARSRGASVEILLGDARLTLERLRTAAPEKFGILIVDAFNSDAPPLHLLTREALQIYLNNLREDGLLVFNLSNRHLDLRPVLGNLAAVIGLTGYYQFDLDATAPGKSQSLWVVLARNENCLDRLQNPKRWAEQRMTLGGLLIPLSAAGLPLPAMLLSSIGMAATGPPWQPLFAVEEVGVWTDDFSNLFRVVRKW